MNPQQLLNSWLELKTKILAFKKTNFTKEEMKLLKFLSDKLSASQILPDLGITLDKATENLDLWVSHQYENKIDRERKEVEDKLENVENDVLMDINIIYWNFSNTFKVLTQGWCRERHFYNESKKEINEMENRLEKAGNKIRQETDKKKILIKSLKSAVNKPLSVMSIAHETSLNKAQRECQEWKDRFYDLRGEINNLNYADIYHND